jgi:nucleotide-binding universal stress UspA family protein
MGGETQDQEIEVRKLGQAAADEAAAVLASQGVAATVELVHDRPDAAIIAVSDEHDARYIVVGATGVGPLRGAVLGSVTYKLVHRSSRPVVVVPRKA